MRSRRRWASSKPSACRATTARWPVSSSKSLWSHGNGAGKGWKHGQATVLETPKDHEPPFWSQHISGNPYTPALDPEEHLPPMTELQRKSCRNGRPKPIATPYRPQKPIESPERAHSSRLGLSFGHDAPGRAAAGASVGLAPHLLSTKSSQELSV